MKTAEEMQGKASVAMQPTTPSHIFSMNFVRKPLRTTQPELLIILTASSIFLTDRQKSSRLSSAISVLFVPIIVRIDGFLPSSLIIEITLSCVEKPALQSVYYLRLAKRK